MAIAWLASQIMQLVVIWKKYKFHPYALFVALKL